MPPLQQRNFNSAPKAKTEEELRQEAERIQKEQELYQVMHELAPYRDRRWYESDGGATVRSKKATYPLTDEPEMRKMTAWLETTNWRPSTKHMGVEVRLMTQVIEEVEGHHVRDVTAPESRVTAENGKLTYADWTDDHLMTHEECIKFLGDVGDTLQLIVGTNTPTP